MDDQARLRTQIERLSGAIDSRREQMARVPTHNVGGSVRGRGRKSLRPYRHRSLVFTHAPTNPAGTVSETQVGNFGNSQDRDQSSSLATSGINAHKGTNTATATTDHEAETERLSTTKSSRQEKELNPFSETSMTSLNSASLAPSTSALPRSLESPVNTTEWVRKRSSKSMALMNANVYHPYIKPPRPSTVAPRSRSSKPKKDNVRRGERMGEVLVDGVVFVFDASGTKLVKKSSLPSANEQHNDETQELRSFNEPATKQTFDSSSPQSNTPLHASVNGTKYIRTKNGNLINQELVIARQLARNRMRSDGQIQAARNVVQQDKSRYVDQLITRLHATSKRIASRKSSELCAYYTRSGVCRRGAQCPFLHDDTKRALCPGALKPTGCTHAHCLLSHTPSPNSSPHCVHYLRSGECRNDGHCRYTHANLAPDAPLCVQFSRLGWCEEGAACRARHARECPDFAARGTCPNKHCHLAHLGTDLPSPVSAIPASVPETDMLFVRDDVAAKLDPEPESMFTEGPGSALFAGQNDFISLDGEQDDGPEDPSDADRTTRHDHHLNEHLQETQSVSSASVSDDSMEYDSDSDASEQGIHQDHDGDAVTSDKEVDQALGGL